MCACSRGRHKLTWGVFPFCGGISQSLKLAGWLCSQPWDPLAPAPSTWRSHHWDYRRLLLCPSNQVFSLHNNSYWGIWVLKKNNIIILACLFLNNNLFAPPPPPCMLGVCLCLVCMYVCLVSMWWAYGMCVYVHKCMYMYACTCVCIPVCIYVDMCSGGTCVCSVCTCVCMCISLTFGKINDFTL